MSPTGVFWIVLLVFASSASLTVWMVTIIGSRERRMGQRLAEVRQARAAQEGRAGTARGGLTLFGASAGLHRALRRRRLVATDGGGPGEAGGDVTEATAEWETVATAAATGDEGDGASSLGVVAAQSAATAGTTAAAGAAQGPSAAVRQKASFRARVMDALEKPLRGVNLAKGLALDLRKADVKLKVSEFILICLGSGLLGLMVGAAVTGSLLFGLLALAGGLFIPRWWVDNRKTGRARLFDRQLPDALNMISSSLRSGYSLLQSIGVVAREMPAPISEEFSRVIKESQFNIPVEEAMANLAERIDSVDLDLAITAMIIQRQVGGNLSEVLDNITTTIRERIRIMGEIRTLTAQGRVSGWIVALLPVGLAVVTYLINPGYIRPLFIHPMGQFMLGLAAGMQLIGLFFIRRIINVQV